LEEAQRILDVNGLTTHYITKKAPVKAVENVSFEIGSNEIFGIVGESGCGKSTLAASLLRLLKPPGKIISGEVFFDGVDLLKLPSKDLRRLRWNRLSYIPQGAMNSLNPVMKVGKQIEEVIKIHKGKIPKREMKKRIEELLKSVGLDPVVANSYPHELSGGMKQRTIIAMATALSPRLIIADEPATALDVVVQRGILQLLLHVKEQMNSSIILITHDMAAQAEVCDRLAVMYAGDIVEIGDIRRLLGDPQHPYSQALISSIPSLTEEKHLKGLPGFPPDLRFPPSGCKFHPRCSRFMPGLCDKVPPLTLEVKGREVECHLYK